ncbi:SigB/SigF/SigG family RNA polymerase sigma factor [Actinomadura sp. KC06]|uniref:SigB/SigF/SigG family RNA polymerase sigma factor n=1 Tax=Actinomadura sp. KC06 TaxID=2530369 RepID=UPI00104C9BBD|nr:SigB/SigF/SigG family RNA polymerase sigma factor [Actinomadura sp. KC06]TDD20582.1 SigB/SigF/SigG family RNA polymerase sigma factor [Actinomadura sp. KC06]
MTDAPLRGTAFPNPARCDTGRHDTRHDPAASSATASVTGTVTPTGTAGVAGTERASVRFADADRRTAALLADLHRLGPGDPGRERLRAEITALNTTFVRSIARRYAGCGEPIEDLEHVAFMGLVMAINRFDPTRGIRFWVYAYPVVVGEVRRHFRDKTWVLRVSRRIQKPWPLLQRATAAFTAEHGRSPTTAELAGRVGIGEEEAVEVLLACEAYRPQSLDAPAGGPADADSGTIGEHLGADDSALDHVVDGQALRSLLAQLPERERTIVLLRFFGNHTQSQIAAQLGVSQIHVSRLLTQTLQRLRRSLLTGTEPPVAARPPTQKRDTRPHQRPRQRHEKPAARPRPRPRHPRTNL